MRRRLAGYLLALSVFLADQGTKEWVLYGLNLPMRRQVRILPVLNFTMVWNHGITFGILSGENALTLLVLVAAGTTIGLAIWLWRSTRWSTALALGAIIGGAIGNVVSRIDYGAVVDFIDVHIGAWHWYVFNFADAAIVCGVGVLIAENLLRRDAASSHLPDGESGDKEAS